jgi:hypothetical protein
VGGQLFNKRLETLIGFEFPWKLSISENKMKVVAHAILIKDFPDILLTNLNIV